MPESSQPITEPTTQKEEACTVEGESTQDGVECTSHAGEVEVAGGSEMAEERLFTVRCAPGGNLEHVHTADASHRKRRKFKFKKGAVAPQEQT